MYTVKQAAEKLKLSQAAIYRMVNAQVMPHHRIGEKQRTIRITDEDITTYLEISWQAFAPQQPEESRSRRSPRPTLKHLKL